MTLEATRLTVGRHRPLLSDISISTSGGRPLCLLGPNGVGKSTLLATLAGLLDPLAGAVSVGGIDVASMSHSERARRIAYTPQASADQVFPFSVRESVMVGRAARVRLWGVPSSEDKVVVEEVLRLLAIEHLSARSVNSLSGGERRLVAIARALVQQPDVLLLDEPLAGLDRRNEEQVLEHVRELANAGVVLVLATHDPNHAIRLDGDVLHAGIDTEPRPWREAMQLPILRDLYGEMWSFGRVEGTECWVVYSTYHDSRRYS